MGNRKTEPAAGPATVTGGIDLAAIPPYVAENLAQVALQEIRRAYNDPIIRADYERWKAERAGATA